VQGKKEEKQEKSNKAKGPSTENETTLSRPKAMIGPDKNRKF